MFKQLFLLFSLLGSIQLSGQPLPLVAIGGCTSAEIVSGVPNNYQVDLYVGPFGSINYVDCDATLQPGAPSTAMRPRFFIQKYNHSSGTWVSHAGPQASSKFNNLPHGTYRISGEVPIRFSNIECPGGLEVYNTSAQLLGHWGTYSGGGFGPSNVVIVGKTVSSDIAYHYVDGGGGDALPNGFDYQEVVTMNASASKNYNLYWLAIFENTAPYRVWGQGWTPTDPISGVGSLNLTQRAVPVGFAPNFGSSQSLSQYTVQFAIENQACINQSWTNSDQVFIVCPSSLGCRFEQPQLGVPKLSPNPSSGSLQVSSLAVGEYQLKIVDLSGRTIDEIPFQAGEEISLEGISAGMYAVSIWSNGVRLHTEKLVINL